MTQKDILAKVDHTLLAQTATWEEIRQICNDGMRYETASVCIPPAYVEQAKNYVGDRLTTAVKEFETKDALKKGADEIDMVINLGWVKDGRFDLVEKEIRTLKDACGGNVLKVIIETCLLTEEEKVKMCEVVTNSGADFIKTSTGFSTSGATFADVALFKEHVGPQVKIKAAGGISSFADAEKFVELGADRLGTSRLVKIMKQNEK